MLDRSDTTSSLVVLLFTASAGLAHAQQSLDELPPEVEATYGASAPIATEEAKLVASDAADGDSFGGVAVSGDTAVVGAVHDDHAGGVDAGSAYVFVRNGTTWSEQVKLVASDAAPGDNFGSSVAIDGDTIVVGAWADGHAGAAHAGSAYVFVRNGTTWSEQAKLVADDPVQWASVGYAVAVSGDTAFVGAPFFNLEASSDRVYVFARSGPSWSLQQVLFASDLAITFGWSIACWGDTAVIGSTGAGAYVFARSGATWSEQQKLTPSDPTFSYFGISVAGAGDTVAVGAPYFDLTEPGSGYVFVRSGTTWSEQQKLVASDAEDGDYFGGGVALSGDNVVVGALLDDHVGSTDAGSAYVFARSGTTWSEQSKLVASDAANGDQLGLGPAISGELVLVGAGGNDEGGIDAGAVYAFRPFGPPPLRYCTAGTSASGCQALLSVTGLPSATAASGFVLSATGVEGTQDGVFFFGGNGKQASPWGNGTSYQCVVPPVKRATALAGTGSAGECDGAFAEDLNAFWCPTCPKPHKNPGMGVAVQAQLWYRDPASTSNQTTSLSDAIEFVLGP